MPVLPESLILLTSKIVKFLTKLSGPVALNGCRGRLSDFTPACLPGRWISLTSYRRFRSGRIGPLPACPARAKVLRP